MPRPTDKERARLFVAKARPSIAGSHGHDALFAVACGLVVGFGLSDGDAYELLQEYNAASCTPSWGERDLRRKLEHARRQADRDPSKVGELVRTDRADYTGPRSPANTAKPIPSAPAKKSDAGTPQSKVGSQSRTARTPLFNVHRFGEGAEHRTARTLRTLPVTSFIQPFNSTSDNKSKEKVSEVYVKPAATIKPTKAVPIRDEPLAKGCAVTTVYKTGEVVRQYWDGRTEQRKSFDPSF